MGVNWGLALFTQRISVIWPYDSADPLRGCCSTANALLKTQRHWVLKFSPTSTNRGTGQTSREHQFLISANFPILTSQLP